MHQGVYVCINVQIFFPSFLHAECYYIVLLILLLCYRTYNQQYRRLQCKSKKVSVTITNVIFINSHSYSGI